ncbi:MAG: hypothetical protein HOQ30_04245 [Gemmatimonadaceae bacterium]|nr:hypothetical protein [Gemmatimonadaceae bacterium]NUR33199.1 hypothetical protein [Gemmatimonadaceae bacterium]
MRSLAQAARMLGLCAAAALAGACARERAPGGDTMLVATAARSPVVIGVGGKPACRGTGHWTDCAVLKRLEAAGVAPQVASELPDLPEIAAKPLLFKVGRSGLAVYLFADSTSRARAARGLDTLHYVSAAKELTMRGETTAIQSDNLLALLYSRSEQQRERVSDAFLAGPPQPDQH